MLSLHVKLQNNESHILTLYCMNHLNFLKAFCRLLHGENSSLSSSCMFQINDRSHVNSDYPAPETLIRSLVDCII